MDCNLNCKACQHPYTTSNFREPRSLPCGHTVCLQCLTQVLINTKLCPICKQSVLLFAISRLFWAASEGDFPVNKSVLEVVMAESKKIFEKEFKELRNDYSEAEETLTALFKAEKFGFDELTSKWSEVDRENIIQTLSSSKKKLLDTLRSLYIVQHNKALNPYSDTLTLKLEEFTDSQLFLTELYNQIHRGEKYFAVLDEENQTKYAELSIWQSRLQIHSLQNLDDSKVAFKAIRYSDLKKCLWERNTHEVFLKINSKKDFQHHITVQLNDTHLRAAFIKMCVGESEISFKYKAVNGFLGGETSENEENFSLIYEFNFGETINDLGKLYTALQSSSDVSCDPNKQYLALMNNHFFLMKLKNEVNSAFIIGKVVCEEIGVVAKPDYKHKNYIIPIPGKTDIIKDCGISLVI